LRGEIRFARPLASANPGAVPAPERRIDDFSALARACNQFYLARMRAELDVLRSVSGGPWLERFEQMIGSIGSALDEGRAMLLRVGRHCGAKSLTLDRLRWIQIRRGRGEHYWAREATTIWLAGEHEDRLGDLRPFGWLIAERAGSAVDKALEQWCEDEGKRATASDAVRIVRTEERESRELHRTSDEIQWEGARLKYNVRNGTLTAIGPQKAEAHALAPNGEALLSGLPNDLQAKLRAGQFVPARAHVRKSVLVAVHPRP
jgi:CRISPR-associated protein Csm5